MSAPPMATARLGSGGDLEAKVRQKLGQDGLLDELGEEPYTMEDGSTGPGFDDLCDYLPGEVGCSADELRLALEAVRKSILDDAAKQAEKPKPATRAVKTTSSVDLAAKKTEPSEAAVTPRPKPVPKATSGPGAKPSKPPPKAKALPAARHDTSGPEPDSSKHSAAEKPSTDEAKSTAPKPRVLKPSVSSSDVKEAPASSGDTAPRPLPGGKPPRQKPMMPGSQSMPDFSLVKKESGERNHRQDPVMEEPSSANLYDNPKEKDEYSAKPVKLRPNVSSRVLDGTEAAKEAPVRSSRVPPPKPSRPASAYPALSPTDAGFAAALERSTSPEQKGVPSKPVRRGTSAEGGPTPAAMPRKPVRDRAKTMLPAAAQGGGGGSVAGPPPAGPGPGPGAGETTSGAAAPPRLSPSKLPVATTEEEDDADGMYEVVKSPGGRSDGQASSDSGYLTPQAQVESVKGSPPHAGQDKEKPAAAATATEEHGCEKTEAKVAAKKTLTLSRFGLGKQKKKAITEDDIDLASIQSPVAEAPPSPLPTPAARNVVAPKQQPSGDWSAQDINLTAEQLIQIMQLVKQGKCTQEEAIERMKDENRHKAAAARAAEHMAVPTKDGRSGSVASHHTDDDAGDDMYETPGQPTASPAVNTTEPTVDDEAASKEHADGDVVKDTDKHAKTATLKGKLHWNFRKKKDASMDDFGADAGEAADADAKKKKGKKKGGIFSKKSSDKEAKDDSPPTSPMIAVDAPEDEPEEDGDMYATVGPSPSPSPTPSSALTSVESAPGVLEEEAQDKSALNPPLSVKRSSKTMLSGLKDALSKSRSSTLKTTDTDVTEHAAAADAIDSTPVLVPISDSPTPPAAAAAAAPVPVPVPDIKEPEQPPYAGPFVAKAVVEMPYNPSPYDTASLSLQVDDVVNVIEMAENGTWRGEVNGKVGKFKFIYVRVLDDENAPADDKRPDTPPSPSRLQTTPPIPKTLEDMFKQLNLPQYMEVFRENGYDDLSFVRDIDTAKSLTEIGVADSAHQEAILFMVDVLNAENKKRSGSLSKRSHRLSTIGLVPDVVFSPKERAMTGVEPGDAPARPQPRQRAATGATTPSKPGRNIPPRPGQPAVAPARATNADGPAKPDSSSSRSLSPEPSAPSENAAAAASPQRKMPQAKSASTSAIAAQLESSLKAKEKSSKSLSPESSGAAPENATAVSPKRMRPQPKSTSAFAAQLESSLKATGQADKEKGGPGVGQRRSTFNVRSSNTTDSRALAKQAVAKRRSLEEGDIQEHPAQPVVELKADAKKRRAPAPPSEAKPDGNDQSKQKPSAPNKASTIAEEDPSPPEPKKPLLTAKPSSAADQVDGSRPAEEAPEKPDKSQRSAPPRPGVAAVAKPAPVPSDGPPTPKASRNAPKRPGSAGAKSASADDGATAGDAAPTAAETEESKKHMDALRKRLAADNIKLSAAPYSLRSGTGGIPAGLVQRLAMDTRIAITGVAPTLEKLRQESLAAAQRAMVPCKPVSTSGDEWMTLASKAPCLYEWLHAIGLPMHNEALANGGYDIRTVNELTDGDMKELGMTNVLHFKRILRAAAALQL